MPKFTEDELIAAAKARYRKPICIDSLRDAMQEDTLEDAVTMLLMESAMWDSPTGDPLDTTNIIPIHEEFCPFNTVNS